MRMLGAALALSLACAPASAQIALPLARYTYTATLTQNALEMGTVNASGIAWNCQGRACTVSGPWPAPGVAACMALAARVGVIASYGRTGAMLGAAQLTQCNAQARRPATGEGVPSQESGAAAPARPGVAIRSSALTLTGTGALAARAPFTATSIRTNTLTLTGTGALAARSPFTPTTIRTQTLTLTGEK